MMYVIQQGDQYYIPIIITKDGVEMTNENCDDVKIKIDAITKKASNGEISYSNYTYDDEERSAWLFPITQLQTLSWKAGKICIQAQIKQGDTIIGSDVELISVEFSIIGDEW